MYQLPAVGEHGAYGAGVAAAVLEPGFEHASVTARYHDVEVYLYYIFVYTRKL